MELKEGMYVRYKTLSNRIKIAKIIEIDKKVLDLDNKDCTTEKYIIGEPSHNIIDLIEVGDYVNGYKVVEIDEYGPISSPKQKYLKVDCSKLFNALYIENIKSIVTKEQFESMEYKIR